MRTLGSILVLLVAGVAGVAAAQNQRSVDGDVVAVNAIDGNHSDVVFTRGSDDGLAIGWHATILDPNGRPIADQTCKLTTVSPKTSRCRMNVGMKTITHGTAKARFTP